MELLGIFEAIFCVSLFIIGTVIILIRKEKNKYVLIITLLIIRLIYSIIRYWFNLPPDMPDINFFEEQINLFVNSHMSIGVINPRFDVRNYIVFNGIIRYFFGNAWVMTVVINSILGTLAIYNAGNIAKQIAGEKAKKLTYLFLAFEPTIFLYTNTHLREAIVLFTITLAFVYLTKYIIDKKNINILLYFLISIVSGLFRTVNIFVLIIVGLTTILLTKNKKSIDLKKFITIILAIVLGLALLKVLESVLGFSVEIKYINENLNRDMLGGGTMPYLVGERYDSWIHLIISIPKRLLYFTLHPFPWIISNIKHVIPFVSSLYNLIFIGIFFIFFIKRKKDCNIYGIINKLVIILLVSLVIYAVVKSESASRHRLQFMWLLPVITACQIYKKETSN